MKLSERIQSMPYSSIRKLVPYANKAKEAGKKVYHLNIGAPDVETPEVFFDAIKDLDMDVLTYAPSPGTPGLVKAWSDYYKSNDIPLEPEEIIITAGGSEALLFGLLAVTDPGDEVLTCEPYYANYYSYFIEAGVEYTTFPTEVENGFHLPEREVIESKITDKTKVILLSNPGNPTGTVYTKDEVLLIADLAKKHDLYIFADEVYREFIFDGAEYLSFGSIEEIQDHVVILDSISKRFSACGARIGCAASKNKDVVDAIAKLATGRLAVPTIEMIGAEALYKMDDSYFKKVNAEYQSRRDHIYELLTNIEGVTTSKTAGAFYMMADLPVDDADVFCQWLLEEFDVDGETLMMAPAAGFYQNQEKYKSQVRIAFVLNNDSLTKAMHILEEGLKAYNAR